MAYFRCTVGGNGKGNTVVVTCAEEFAGETITLSKTGKTYTKTCPSSSPYTVTYYGVENGTYTVSCTVDGQTYSETVVVQDISCVLNYGFNWKTWVDTASQLDSSDYASLSEVLADEKALRELFLEHACVDYMAEATSSNADLVTIINDDYCAKWINNSDYALDFLGANTVIKALMDTADKYGYGEWVITDDTTTPPTWGAKGNVPVMTANTAPYGEANGDYNVSNYEPYRAFNGDVSSATNHYASGNNGYLQYKFTNPICPKMVMLYTSRESQYLANSYKVQGSNNGTNFTDLLTISDPPQTVTTKFTRTIETSDYFLYLRVVFGTSAQGSIQVPECQFYGRELKVSVPTMTSNTAPFGEAINSSYASGYEAYKAFDNNTSTAWTPTSNATNNYVGYHFTNPIKPKSVYLYASLQSGYTRTFTVQGSNDGFVSDIDNIGTIEVIGAGTGKDYTGTITATEAYEYIRIFCAEVIHVSNQYNVSVGSLQFYGLDYSEKEFEAGTTKKWLYDHGVELETMDVVGYTQSGISNNQDGTKQSDSIRVSASSGNSYCCMVGPNDSIDLTNYSSAWVNVRYNTIYNNMNTMIMSSKTLSGSADAYVDYPKTITSDNMRAVVDVSAINQNKYIAARCFGYGSGASGSNQNMAQSFDLLELWLE